MNTTLEPWVQNEARIAYMRPVTVAELPRELRVQAHGARVVDAVHDGAGERLALVRDKRLAFVLARQNVLTPVHVH